MICSSFLELPPPPPRWADAHTFPSRRCPTFYAQNSGLCLVGKDCSGGRSLGMTSINDGNTISRSSRDFKGAFKPNQPCWLTKCSLFQRASRSSVDPVPLPHHNRRNKILWSNLHCCNAADWKHVFAHTLAASASVRERLARGHGWRLTRSSQQLTFVCEAPVRRPNPH